MRTISQESADVSVNETRIILLQQNRAEKVWGDKKTKEDPIRHSCRWRNISVGAAVRSITAVQQFGQIIEWWQQWWRRRWYYRLQNSQDLLHRADGEVEIWFNALYAINISAQSAMTIEIFPQVMIIFGTFVLDHKH